MTTDEALEALGVRDDTLSDAEKAQLDAGGYLPLPGILDAQAVAAINTRLGELLVEEGTEAGREFEQEPGADRLSDLVNKDPRFDVCFSHPRVLAGIAHVLGRRFKLSSLNFRSARPGQGLQALHADWDRAVGTGEFQVCNSIWLLDDFTAHNGATRVVPGTQRNERLPEQALADPVAPHPPEVILEAPAGTVVVFNSHTWHGGTLNRSAAPRRAMHSYFVRPEHPQQLDQRSAIRRSTYERLSAPARTILDVDGALRPPRSSAR